MSQIIGSGILLLTKINSKIHIILYRGVYKKEYEDKYPTSLFFYTMLLLLHK